MFKNANIFTVTPGFRFDPELLKRRPARPCNALEHRTDGFIAPCDHATHGLIHEVGGMQVLCWQTEDKLLPSSVVSEAVAERIEKIETEQSRKVGRKEAREIKERVTEELLPKAFVQHRNTLAVLTDRFLIINTSSVARADDFISSLFKTHGDGVPIRPLQVNQPPAFVMTGWLLGNELPEGINLENTLELRNPNDRAESISYKNSNVEETSVRTSIENGKMASKLGMTWRDRTYFVLDALLNMKRIAYLDVVQEQINEQAEDAASLFDAEMIASIGDITGIVDDLCKALGGIYKPDDDLVPAA